MYKIEQTDYGLRLTFGGFIQEQEMKHWVADFIGATSTQSGNFSVFVDMRSLRPLPPESQTSMKMGQKYARLSGMKRSVVILENATTTMQFKRIAKQTGIYEWERYINATSNPDWENTGLDWLINGVDPDREKLPEISRR